MRCLRLLLLLGALAGCSDRLAARQAALSALVGHSEAEIVQAMGVPVQTYEADGTRFLVYRETQTQLIPGTPASWFGPGLAFYSIPPRVMTWTCETTLVLVEGRVTNYALRGNGCG